MLLAGIIHSQRIQMTRRGRMAVIMLDDGNARIELTVFNELFEQHRHWLKEDQLLIVEGKVAHDDFSGSLRVSAEKLFDLQSARTVRARHPDHCNGESSGRKLQEMLAALSHGKCPVHVVYSSKGAICEIDLGEEWRVDPQDALIGSLSEWLKPQNVQVVYPQAPRMRRALREGVVRTYSSAAARTLRTLLVVGTHLDIRDVRARRTVPRPCDQSIDRFARALHDRLDSAVEPVSDPARDAAPACFARHVMAKADALDAAGILK